jgi:hypothetical protein
LLRCLSISHTIDAALQSLHASNGEIEALIEELYVPRHSPHTKRKGQG